MALTAGSSHQMLDTAPHAFFFDANAEGVGAYYGGEFDPAFLRALVFTGTNSALSSRVLRGDAIISMLCTRVTAVSQGHKGQSWTQGHDMELYRTVIWDLADAFAEQWNTLDLESFPLVLARGRVHCIVLPTFPTSLREAVDEKLQGTRGYLGALDLDLGNPLQLKVFIENLVDDAFIANGQVCLERGWDGADETAFEGASDFSPRGELRLPQDQFAARKPPLPHVSGLSARGRVSRDRYEGKQSFTIEDRVIRAITQLRDAGKNPFAFSSSPKSESVLEADLPEAKFVRYLLNPDHADGAGKAKFFHDVLSIVAADWRYLAAQFYEGLLQTNFADLKIKVWEDGFGASFNCILPVTGLNGRVVKVFTNWIMRPGQLPQLSTARPEEEEDGDLKLLPGQTNIVSASLAGSERWAELYRLASAAGATAAEQCVPTPMKIGGFPVEMEGACGYAFVRIPEARKGFARWVIRSKVGRRHHQGGAAVPSNHPSQSVDRAVAYAKVFASVLKLNGVECTVESFFD
jgi:hypothetical protein